MRDSSFVTVQNSQFSIRIRFANNANGRIRRICTRRYSCQFASEADFLTKSKDANHHKSRIVWPHQKN